MKRYINKKSEKVVELIGADFASHKFVFGKLSRIDAESIMVGALKGGVAPFITAHKTADRDSESIKVNVRRVPAYKVSNQPLPAKVTALIAKIPDLQATGKEEELEALVAEISAYFDQA